MISVAPNDVNYVSPVYGANASDRHIVQTSGILKNFVKVDSIIANKGFPRKDTITEVVEMITPANLFNQQFTKCEVIHNREMAEAQIHDGRLFRDFSSSSRGTWQTQTGHEALYAGLRQE